MKCDEYFVYYETLIGDDWMSAYGNFTFVQLLQLRAIAIALISYDHLAIVMSFDRDIK